MSDDILRRMRSLIEDHSPTGWPAVRACEISALCDEITRLRAFRAAAQPPAVMPVPADVLRDAGRYRWLEEHTVATGLSRWIDNHRTQFLGVAVDQELATVSQAQSVPATGAQPPSVTPMNVGRWCMSEDECRAAGIDFAAYERGVCDAAEAFARNKP